MLGFMSGTRIVGPTSGPLGALGFVVRQEATPGGPTETGPLDFMLSRGAFPERGWPIDFFPDLPGA